MSTEFERPFPALTAAQRYYLDVFGYVVVPSVLSPDECETIRGVLKRIQSEVRAPNYAQTRSPYSPISPIDKPHHTYLNRLIEGDPALTAYISHPRIVGMAEEILGGGARLVEFNGQINSRDPQANFSEAPKYDFHRGTDIPFSSHTWNGLYHSSFVKTLTYLTELGPDDGGTVVIAGSHKMVVPDEDSIAAAYADPRLIHQVVAPIGSTLLFHETLIHATGQLRSERERAIIVSGYGVTMYPYWEGGEMSPEFLAMVPDHLSTLFKGNTHWGRSERYRTLTDPVDPRTFTLQDGWWAPLQNLAPAPMETATY